MVGGYSEPDCSQIEFGTVFHCIDSCRRRGRGGRILVHHGAGEVQLEARREVNLSWQSVFGGLLGRGGSFLVKGRCRGATTFFQQILGASHYNLYRLQRRVERVEERSNTGTCAQGTRKQSSAQRTVASLLEHQCQTFLTLNPHAATHREGLCSQVAHCRNWFAIPMLITPGSSSHLDDLLPR